MAYTAGQRITAALLNQQAVPPMAQLYQTVAQTLTTSVFAPISMGAAAIDTVGGWNATNPTRYTSQLAGTYQLSGQIAYAPNATGVRDSRIYKNGATLMPLCQAIENAVSAGQHNLVVPTTLVHMEVGDYVEIWAYQSSGGSLATVYNGVNNTSGMNVLYVSTDRSGP